MSEETEASAPTASSPPRPHWSMPPWGIFAIGAVATGAALIWSASLHDPVTGDALIDETMAKILIGLIGTTGTVMAVLLQRIGDVRHQVKNDHPSNLRDDIDAQAEAIARLSGALGELRAAHDHETRARRDMADWVKQLREDVQAGRVETGEVRADVRGLRKDLGWIRDFITKGTTP